MRTQTFLILLVFFASCNSLAGKIEKRDSQCSNAENSRAIFLVNKSPSQKYEFTVRCIETLNDSIHRYSTQQVILAPGDERNLGCDTYYSDYKYRTVEEAKLVTDDDKIYEYNGKSYSKNDMVTFAAENNLSLEKYLDELPNLSKIELYDTVVNNVPAKYKKDTWTDDSKIVSKTKHTYKYEVTGQVPLYSERRR